MSTGYGESLGYGLVGLLGLPRARPGGASGHSERRFPSTEEARMPRRLLSRQSCPRESPRKRRRRRRPRRRGTAGKVLGAGDRTRPGRAAWVSGARARECFASQEVIPRIDAAAKPRLTLSSRLAPLSSESRARSLPSVPPRGTANPPRPSRPPPKEAIPRPPRPIAMAPRPVCRAPRRVKASRPLSSYEKYVLRTGIRLQSPGFSRVRVTRRTRAWFR